jgi:hypothetical protein
MAQASPKLTVSPSSLSFSSTPSGTASAPKTITLKNSGAGTLQIAALSVSGDHASEFSLTNGCTEALPSNGTCTISVTFRPTAEGARLASLLIKSNVAERVMSLKGTGAAPPQPALTLSPTSVSFSSTVTGVSSEAKTVSVKNTGKGTLQISTITVTGEHRADFVSTNTCGSPVAPSGSCSISVSFKPSATGTRSAQIEIKGNVATKSLSLRGSGTAPPQPSVVLSPSSLSFSSQIIGTQSTVRVVTVKNTGAGTLRVSTITLVGASADQFESTNTCGAPMQKDGICTVSVVFRPASAGTHAAAIEIKSNTATKSISLKGIATNPPPPKLTVSPSSLTFATQPVGTQSRTQSLTLKNTGGSILQIATISLAGTHQSEYLAVNDCGAPIAPGASCTVGVSFIPRGEGSRTATLEIKGNIDAKSIVVRGTGGAAPAAASLTIDAAPLTIRAGESRAIAVTIKTAEGVKIFGRSLTWESSAPKVATVSSDDVVSAVGYDGFDVKFATLTARLGNLSASTTIRVIPKEKFDGYRVDPSARSLGSAYWENTTVPLDLVIRIFLTRHKNYGRDPQYQFQYSGWSGALTAGDFNAEGFIDVFTAGSACNGWQSRPTFLLWNPETWRFEEKNLFNDGTDYLGGPMGIAPAYLNDDDYVDLVIMGHGDECGTQTNEPVTVAISDGKGGYDLKTLELEPKDLAERFGHELGDLGDVSGDGVPELYINANSHSYIFSGLSRAPYFSSSNFAHFASDTKNFPGAQNGFGERVPNASEFAFGGKIEDFDGDGLNDMLMLTSEDVGTPRQSRIFFNQGTGRFVADKFVNLPFFYDDNNPNQKNRVAHLMDAAVVDVNQDGLSDIVGINQESYKNWNIVVYLKRPDGKYVIDRDVVAYNVNSMDERKQYKTTLIHADFDGDQIKDFSYTSFGKTCVDIVRKTAFLRKNGKLVETAIADIDPYAKWLISKIVRYGDEADPTKYYYCPP